MTDRRGHRVWKYVRRAAPIAVIAVAITIYVLDVTDRLTQHVFERLLVLAVGLLAVDALIERVDLLERIERVMYTIRQGIEPIEQRASLLDEIARHVSSLAQPAGLTNRSTLNAEMEFAGAREIDFAGITLVNVLLDRRGLLEKLLRDGAKVRVLLLKPESNSWAAWNDAVTNEDTEAHRKTSLGILRGLIKLSPDNIEVRYSPHLLPTSLVIVDRTRNTAHLVAEIIFPGMAGFERPHVVLKRVDEPHWFEFMVSRFDSLWDASTKVELSVGTNAGA